MKRVAILIIQLYRRFISPFLPPRCRFFPTCSQYAIDALQKYGFFKGCRLSLGRVLRCHPWGGYGHDPVK